MHSDRSSLPRNLSGVAPVYPISYLQSSGSFLQDHGIEVGFNCGMSINGKLGEWPPSLACAFVVRFVARRFARIWSSHWNSFRNSRWKCQQEHNGEHCQLHYYQRTGTALLTLSARDPIQQLNRACVSTCFEISVTGTGTASREFKSWVQSMDSRLWTCLPCMGAACMCPKIASLGASQMQLHTRCSCPSVQLTVSAVKASDFRKSSCVAFSHKRVAYSRLHHLCWAVLHLPKKKKKRKRKRKRTWACQRLCSVFLVH